MGDALPILVIGGGISGLALGIALLRLGLDVIVFDKARKTCARKDRMAGTILLTLIPLLFSFI